MSALAVIPADSPVPVRGQDARTRCDAWYAEHGRAIYRYLRFHVDSADTAEDLAADVFLRAFEAADRFDPARAEARVWLFGIARNALRDHFRRQKVRRHVDVGALRDVAIEAPSPEERLLREEAVARLLEGVAQLSESDRELVSLRYGSELSPTEMAEVLGVREPVVRTRLWRALGRLRELLTPELS
jgi:RNA polymerase sigma-70 factor (ECF subfamily)